ncbi:MAG: poly(A) polymerase, partial [Desulfomonilia bacterium]
RIWEYYRTVYRAYKEDPLVSGSDVITLFGVASGPEVGRCLQAVEEARARGAIRTRSEAIEYLRRFFG